MCAWKIWPSATCRTLCHLTVLSKYSCDFLLNLLFCSAPSTEWKGDALNTEVTLVGKGNISYESSEYPWKKQAHFKFRFPHQDCDPEAHLCAWACRLCVGRMNFPLVVWHPGLNKSVFTWHFPFKCLQRSDYWLTAGGGVGGRRDAAEHLTPRCCCGCQQWHWSSWIPECCFFMSCPFQHALKWRKPCSRATSCFHSCCWESEVLLSPRSWTARPWLVDD